MKSNFVLSVLIFLFLSQTINSQSNIQWLVQSGQNKAYNMEFDDAEKIYNRIIDTAPQQPHGYFYTAQLHFWLFLGTRDPGEYLTFLKFADIAEKKIEQILDSQEENYRILYMAGSLASFRAMANATNNSTIDAFWSSKKAVDYFEKSLQVNPKFYDAYFGLGLFDYAMSFVPNFLKWAVNLSGLSANRERGLQYIKTAFRRGAYDKTESSYHLSKIYSDYLAEYDSSYIYIQNLITKYPKNTLFHYQYAITLIRAKELDKADEVLNRVIRLNNKHIPQITALAHYRKGEIFFKKNQFAEAIKHYKNFLDTSKEIDFNGIAALNIALSYKLLNDNDEYEKYIQLAKEGNLDLFEDAYAKERSERFISRGITETDLFLVQMKNNLDARKYKIVYDSLKSKIDEFSNGRKALALIYFSEAALRQNKLGESFDAAEELNKVNTQNERWVVPYSNLLKALANYRGGEIEAARGFLSDAEENNSYEFRDYIQARIEYLKRHLKGK